jgi:hypothetical protein
MRHNLLIANESLENVAMGTMVKLKLPLLKKIRSKFN